MRTPALNTVTLQPIPAPCTLACFVRKYFLRFRLSMILFSTFIIPSAQFSHIDLCRNWDEKQRLRIPESTCTQGKIKNKTAKKEGRGLQKA